MLNALIALMATALLANAAPAGLAPLDEADAVCGNDCRARVTGSALMAANVPVDEAKDNVKGIKACADASSLECAGDFAESRPDRVIPFATKFQEYFTGFVNALAGLVA